MSACTHHRTATEGTPEQRTRAEDTLLRRSEVQSSVTRESFIENKVIQLTYSYCYAPAYCGSHSTHSRTSTCARGIERLKTFERKGGFIRVFSNTTAELVKHVRPARRPRQDSKIGDRRQRSPSSALRLRAPSDEFG